MPCMSRRVLTITFMHSNVINFKSVKQLLKNIQKRISEIGLVFVCHGTEIERCRLYNSQT